MTLVITDGINTYELEMTYERLQKAVTFFDKDRERKRIDGQKRYVPNGKPRGRPLKDPSVGRQKYQPTGRPRGRPCKRPPSTPEEMRTLPVMEINNPHLTLKN
jgi:hypothetical protein